MSSGTRQLANTDYTVCVRQEREYCSLSWMRNEEDGLFGFTVNGDVSKVDLKDLGKILPPLLSFLIYNVQPHY